MCVCACVCVRVRACMCGETGVLWTHVHIPVCTGAHHLPGRVNRDPGQHRVPYFKVNLYRGGTTGRCPVVRQELEFSVEISDGTLTQEVRGYGLSVVQDRCLTSTPVISPTSRPVLSEVRPPEKVRVGLGPWLK